MAKRAYKPRPLGRGPQGSSDWQKSTPIPRTKKDTWRMVSLLGKWHQVAHNKAFRFYIRVNQLGEQWCFTDYRIDDLVSRFHKLEKLVGQGTAPSWQKANSLVLEMTREQLADLED